MTALHRLNALAGALLIAAALAAGGPALDDLDAAQRIAADTAQAELAAQREARKAAALRALCGENGVAIEQDGNTYRCATKRGYVTTLTAKVTL